MSSITISLIMFACVFGGALFGILLHAVLPPHHLSADSKDIVKLGMGLVGRWRPSFLAFWSRRGFLRHAKR
jgi:hypothetical protein